MPVSPAFLSHSSQLTNLLFSFKYAEARALIASWSDLDRATTEYFEGRIADHEKYLGPFAPRKKTAAQ